MQYSSDTARSYRYGFNGMEKDNEIVGEGDYYAFEYRIHDSRLGRFLSVDPLEKEYPWNSSYAFAENDVIRSKDLEGAEKYIVTITPFMYGKTPKLRVSVRVVYKLNTNATMMTGIEITTTDFDGNILKVDHNSSLIGAR